MRQRRTSPRREATRPSGLNSTGVWATSSAARPASSQNPTNIPATGRDTRPVDRAPPIDLGHALWQHRSGRKGQRVTRADGPVGDRHSSGRHGMNVRHAGSMLWLLTLLALSVPWTTAAAQTDPARTPLPAPVKVRQGMANVPALSPLWLLPAEAAKYNVQVEQVLFQRFADERTALAAGDLDIAAFGPQDITLGLGQGAKSMIGVAGIGSGNDCLLVRKGDDIKEWTGIG